MKEDWQGVPGKGGKGSLAAMTCSQNENQKLHCPNALISNTNVCIQRLFLYHVTVMNLLNVSCDTHEYLIVSCDCNEYAYASCDIVMNIPVSLKYALALIPNSGSVMPFV